MIPAAIQVILRKGWLNEAGHDSEVARDDAGLKSNDRRNARTRNIDELNDRRAHGIRGFNVQLRPLLLGKQVPQKIASHRIDESELRVSARINEHLGSLHVLQLTRLAKRGCDTLSGGSNRVNGGTVREQQPHAVRAPRQSRGMVGPRAAVVV